MQDAVPTPNTTVQSATLNNAQDFLKQIVYGGNDGIVTTFAIVAGFAGAQAQGAAGIGTLAVLVFGLANLFADAVSMGLGEFLSARSQRGLYVMRRRNWTGRLTREGRGAVKDLHPYLDQRGVQGPDAEAFCDLLERHPELAADLVMARVHGMDDPENANLGLRAWVTFFSFVLFGVIPILPYILPIAPEAQLVSATLATFAALALLGLLRWYASRENLLRCLLETVIIGGICAAVAFLVGAIVG